MATAAPGADAIVVGGGLAGLVATAELTARGRRVVLVDQEPEASLGGQAFWSLGGLFLVDSPEQRRMGIRDSHALAWQDWLGTAGFDRPEDEWPRRWADAYVDLAAGEKRAWLREHGIDRMWHYTEGLENFKPIWSAHGIRIISGPSSLWLDARGRRLPPPLFPGYDTLATLDHIMHSGHDHTWFILTQKIVEREFALSGSEQNPDVTARDVAGFGGGGMHGYRALEGTFLGGCLFSGRTAGRAAAEEAA